MKSIFTPLFCLFLIPSFGQNVTLTPNFGAAGIATTPNTSEINKIAVDPDGNIFSAGYSLESGGTGVSRLTVTKHTANGVIDNNFGNNGIVTTVIDHSEFPLDIQLQPDGKILVCGSSYLGPTPSGPGDYRSFAVRYTSQGDLDNSFGTNGVFKLLHTDSHIAKMILLPDGSVLLAGNSYGTAAISKIDQNGAPDPAFGNNGSVFLSDVNFTFILWDAILLSDNTIICAGYDGNDPNNSKIAYCKMDLNGNYVSAFGQNGKTVLDLYNSFPQVTELLSGVKETADGKIILAGYSTTPIIIKANADGTLDTGFGTNGILSHSHSFSDLEIQADGKLIIGGNTEISQYNYGFSITRLNSDGSPDNSFNGTGTFTTDISTGNDYLQTIELIGSEHILIGGSTRLLSTDADFMLVKLTIDQNLEVPEKSNEGIDIYPNPFSENLTILIENKSVTTIRLTDITGKLIGTYPSNTLTTLNLEHLKAGTYQLIFTTNQGEQITKRLMKH